jgi:hypothetical protein
MAIIRDESGLLAICGICMNSLRSIEPEPSLFQMRRGHVIVACEYLGQRAEGSGVRGGEWHLSSFMKRFFSRSSSWALTAHIKHEDTVFVEKSVKWHQRTV